MKPVAADDAAIARAAALLREGRLVAFPTETVYGLGADASNPVAVARIFEAKGRPADHPLIVHIESADKLADWAAAVPESAWRLAERFWPGPMTLILNKKSQVSTVVTGGQDTVGLRVPGHPVALRLLNAFGGGIAAPSANRFKRISPTTAAHVAEELGDRVDMILDGGPCHVGVESAIIDLSGERPCLLRPGSLTRGLIEQVLGTAVPVASLSASPDIRAPGMMQIHYAPVTPAYLCPGDRLAGIVRVESGQGRSLGVLAYRQTIESKPKLHVVTMPESADAYARVLYDALRRLDALKPDLILIETPPESEVWHAVNDRLSRAAVPYR